MKFLSDNHFDFNKCISQGVPYLSRDDHQKISKSRELYMRKAAKSDTKSSINVDKIRHEDRMFLDQVLDKVRVLREGSAVDDDEEEEEEEEEEEIEGSTTTRAWSIKVDSATGNKSMQLPSCNSFRRRLIYESIRTQFNDDIVVAKVSTEERGRATLQVTYFPIPEAKKKT